MRRVPRAVGRVAWAVGRASDLHRRYDRSPRELQLPRALEQSSRADNSRAEMDYLWDLHPLVDWLADRGQIGFRRHCAPVLQLGDGLDPGEVVMMFQGTIPNQKGVPVVQEWLGVRFAGTSLGVLAIERFETLALRLQLGHKSDANPAAPIPTHLSQPLSLAVNRANADLRSCNERWSARMQPQLEAQRDRLKRLRGRQLEQLQRSDDADQRPLQIKEKDRLVEQTAIDERFNDHELIVNEVMTIEPAPYLKLEAVLRYAAEREKRHSKLTVT